MFYSHHSAQKLWIAQHPILLFLIPTLLLPILLLLLFHFTQWPWPWRVISLHYRLQFLTQAIVLICQFLIQVDKLAEDTCCLLLACGPVCPSCFSFASIFHLICFFTLLLCTLNFSTVMASIKGQASTNSGSDSACSTTTVATWCWANGTKTKSTETHSFCSVVKA